MSQKVLVVEDNKMDCELLCRVLEGDYEVLTAENGRAALGLLGVDGAGISAVLLDLVMPEMDGYEVLGRIRENPRLEDIPVIVTTSQDDAEAEVRAFSLGARDFLIKPYNPRVLLYRLKNAIGLCEIAETALRDKLTGLYNREGFFAKAAEMIASRAPGYYVMSSFDVNSFKVINDQYGTDLGDEILKFIAQNALENLKGSGGICSRLAADNYAALYPRHCMDLAEISNLHRFNIPIGEVGPSVTFSVGRYIVEDLSLSVSAMYDRAALAKNRIKGRFDVYVAQYDESMRQEILREQEIVNEMNGALKSGQFEVWLQPQYNLSSGALFGAEALVRWRHPLKGLVPPGKFIPVFERNGFIYELDKYVWEQVCVLLRKWIGEELNPLPLSVNISRCDLFRDDLLEYLLELMQRYELPVGLLRLEITESAFSKSPEQIIRVVESLTKQGFTVEIDDFGSGYSSLNTLKDVPAHVLKLDMRFLENSTNTQRGGSIIESVVRMSKWLGMSVIAEGVETPAQAEFLRSIGCTYVQGYLYAQPMPVEDYERLAASAGKEAKMLALETVQNFNNNSFWDPESMDTLIFNSYVGSSCIFEYLYGRIELLRVNRKFIQMLGHGAEASQGRLLRTLWSDYLNEKDSAALDDALRKSFDDGNETTLEIMFQSLPGCAERMYLRLSLRVIASVGSRYLVYCTAENVSAKKETEQKLRESSEQLRCLMNDTPGGFARMQVLPEGIIVPLYVNEGFCRLMGMTYKDVEERCHNNPFWGVHPDDRESLHSAITEMIELGGVSGCRFRVLHREGGYIWIMILGRATRNESGEIFLNLYFTDLAEWEKCRT